MSTEYTGHSATQTVKITLNGVVLAQAVDEMNWGMFREVLIDLHRGIVAFGHGSFDTDVLNPGANFELDTEEQLALIAGLMADPTAKLELVADVVHEPLYRYEENPVLQQGFELSVKRVRQPLAEDAAGAGAPAFGDWLAFNTETLDGFDLDYDFSTNTLGLHWTKTRVNSIGAGPTSAGRIIAPPSLVSRFSHEPTFNPATLELPLEFGFWLRNEVNGRELLLTAEILGPSPPDYELQFNAYLDGGTTPIVSSGFFTNADLPTAVTFDPANKTLAITNGTQTLGFAADHPLHELFPRGAMYTTGIYVAERYNGELSMTDWHIEADRIGPSEWFHSPPGEALTWDIANLDRGIVLGASDTTIEVMKSDSVERMQPDWLGPKPYLECAAAGDYDVEVRFIFDAQNRGKAPYGPTDYVDALEDCNIDIVAYALDSSFLPTHESAPVTVVAEGLVTANFPAVPVTAEGLVGMKFTAAGVDPGWLFLGGGSIKATPTPAP